MSRSAIRVSVITACYNSSAYLDEAVTSVLGQTLGDLELILIDDCSTDNTLDLARRYQKQDGRVSVLALPQNSGSPVARNAGIRAAKGEWLAILDSDDVAMPSRFEEQLRLADSDKQLALIGSSSISMDTHGRTIREHRYPTRHDDLLRRLLTMAAFPPHSSLMYKHEVVASLPAFDSRYIPSEDYDLCLRLAEVGKMASVDKPLVRMREHAQTQSDSRGGVPSACMGFAAIVCYLLRKHGYPDPSATDAEGAWSEFVTWIERQLIEAGYFEGRHAWTVGRAKYFETGNRLAGALRLGTHLLQSGHATALVWEKLFGSSLPERLADRWMKRTTASVCLPSSP